MKKLIQSMTGNYSSSACVVDGTLIISLPNAIRPVVWRMELGHAKASALEVREDSGGTFSLTLKTPRGDVNDIAPFARKAQAIEALMAVSRAMERAHGQINPVAAGAANDAKMKTSSGGKKGKALTSLVAIILLVILISVFIGMGPQPVPIGGGEETATVSSSSGGGGDRPGVPQSADDFLRGR